MQCRSALLSATCSNGLVLDAWSSLFSAGLGQMRSDITLFGMWCMYDVSHACMCYGSHVGVYGACDASCHSLRSFFPGHAVHEWSFHCRAHGDATGIAQCQGVATTKVRTLTHAEAGSSCRSMTHDSCHNCWGRMLKKLECKMLTIFDCIITYLPYLFWNRGRWHTWSDIGFSMLRFFFGLGSSQLILDSRQLAHDCDMWCKLMIGQSPIVSFRDWNLHFCVFCI